MNNIFCFEFEEQSGYPKRKMIRKRHLALDSIISIYMYPVNDNLDDHEQVLEITCQLLDNPICIVGWLIDVDSYEPGVGYKPSKFKESYDKLFAAWSELKDHS